MAKKAARRPARKTVRRTDSAGGNGKQSRRDGWSNVLTGLGGSKDKRKATTFKFTKRIPDDQLTAIYRANGFGRRVIDLIPNDMTRNWFKVTNDEDDEIKQKLEELGAQKALNHAMKMARLYGGSIVVMGIDDGRDLNKPIRTDKDGNPQNIKAVNYLTVFDRRDVTIQSTQIEKEIDSGRWGQPKQYRIMPRFRGEEVRVHASRVIRFDGADVPWREYESNAYWMDSVLEAVFEHIRQLGAVYDSAEFIVEAFVQTVIKIQNLFSMIAAGQDATLKKRLNWLDMTRHLANTELLDSNEEYQKHSSTVAGLAELIDRFMMAVSAATEIPVTLLMGRSPAGQNSTGESDIRFYYDGVRSRQRNEFAPAVEPLIDVIIASEDVKTKPDSWSIVFNPLHEMTAKEEAELYKLTAEGDERYILNQVLDPDVIGKYRFVGDHFNATPPSMTEDEFMPEEKEEDEPPPQVPPPTPPGAPPAVPPGTQQQPPVPPTVRPTAQG